MKNLLNILPWTIIIALFISVQPQLANSQINPCWKLVCPHDPANGFFNPDSVYVDTCQSSPTYQHEFAKGWFQYIVREENKIILPKFSEDTTIFVSIDDFPSEFARSLRVLDTVLGHFLIKKKYPECSDTTIFASRLFQFKFENYIDVNTYKKVLETCNGFYWMFSKEFLMTNLPRINDINPNWRLPWGHDPDHGYINPDSIMVDWRFCNINYPYPNYPYFCEDYYGKIKMHILNETPIAKYLDTTAIEANLHFGDTLHLNDLDTSSYPLIEPLRYLEKEIGQYIIIFEGTSRPDKTDIGEWEYTIIFNNNICYNNTRTMLFATYLKPASYPGISLYNYNEPNGIIDYYKKDSIDITLNQIQNNISVSFDLQIAGNVNINLVNESGQIVSNIFQGYLNSGQNQVTYNIANLSHGLYFIVLNDGTNTITKKFIK